MRSRRVGLGAALVLVLLAGSVGAAAYVYHARTPDLALEAKLLDRKFAPSADGQGQRSRIAYFVRYDEPEATVELVGRDKAVVRTIGVGVPLKADERRLYRWNGLDDEGHLAPPGPYRLRVILPGQDRDMIFPRRITVEPESFSPESRGRERGGRGRRG